jgi:hypothetical protein
MGTQNRRTRGRNDGKVDVLSEMIRDTVQTIDPRGTHRTWFSLFLPIHQVIDHERPTGQSEQFAQLDCPDWSVTGIQVRRTLLENIVLDSRSLRKPTAQFRHAFPLPHQLNLR